MTQIKVHNQAEYRPCLSGARILRSLFEVSALAKTYRGSLHILSPSDYIETTQEGGTKQSNLLPVSAGSDLRMSTCDLILISSAGIEARRSGTAKAGRGFLRLSSQAN